MKLFCCYTPAHAVLFEHHFLPSIPAEFEIAASRLEIAGPGDFLSAEFLRCIAQKIDLVLESVRANLGAVIVWSDVDVVFFDMKADALVRELGEHDIVFQREHRDVPDVNTGFFVCRCNERIIALFERVRERLVQQPSANEQLMMNELLREGGQPLSWAFLPTAYYARTQGWPPPREMVLYHANATAGAGGVERKLKQFREVAFLRRFGAVALAITSLKYGVRMLWRRLLKAAGREARDTFTAS